MLAAEKKLTGPLSKSNISAKNLLHSVWSFMLDVRALKSPDKMTFLWELQKDVISSSSNENSSSLKKLDSGGGYKLHPT